MRVALRVAETGNLSAAARDLGVSQPAVSQQVVALERHLGTRLFNRTTRVLSLTESGEAYLARARSIVDATQEAADAVADDGEATHRAASHPCTGWAWADVCCR